VAEDPNTNSKTDKRRSVEVEIISKRWGTNDAPSLKTIEVPLISDSAIRLDITVDLRKTDAIVIRPVRRDLDDVDGLIEDAERLANS
jgi:hypothetical protein